LLASVTFIGYTDTMKLEFDSLEEILEFVAHVRLGPIKPEQPVRPTWTNEEVAQELARVTKGDKLAAIKLHRYITGYTLKIAKETLDRYW